MNSEKAPFNLVYEKILDVCMKRIWINAGLFMKRIWMGTGLYMKIIWLDGGLYENDLDETMKRIKLDSN